MAVASMRPRFGCCDMSIVQRLTKVAKALLGTSNETILRSYKPLVQEVNALEAEPDHPQR